MHTPTLIPLDRIDAQALPRDRAHLDPAALDTLQRSILAEGLRQPIELFPIVPETEGAPEWGLVSGLRRLTAFRALAEHLTRFSEIPAFIRTPADIPAALAAMVSENENRSQITPWEKARLITDSTDRGHFDTHDSALKTLFPLLDATARTRLRAVVTVTEALEGFLTDPETYSLRQLLRIATALKAGFCRGDRDSPHPVPRQDARNAVATPPEHPARGRENPRRPDLRAAPALPRQAPQPPPRRADDKARVAPQRLAAGVHRARGEGDDDRFGAGRDRADVRAAAAVKHFWPMDWGDFRR